MAGYLASGAIGVLGMFPGPGGLGTALPALAQTANGAGLIEEVVTIGTRRSARAATDTAVPVDVFGPQEIESINSSDLTDVINTIVPSFNVSRQPISDGATFIRPASLRGLDAHHTLVLVDHKRHHRAALVQLGGFGSHGPDVGTIPSIALDSVEVLRDGAAAQYGSDAIAGVINFNLRRNDSGFDLRTRLGGYTEGDGEELTVETNAGFALGKGFINLSGQYSDSDPTSRSEPYDIAIGESGLTPGEAARSRLTVDGVTWYGPDAFTYTYAADGSIEQVLPGSDGIPDDPDTRFADHLHGVGGAREFDRPVQIWGQPQREQLMLVVNAALPIGDSVELYGFGNHSRKNQSGGFFYRPPGVSQLLPLRLQDGTIYDPRTSLYPAGFTPQFSGKVTDYSIAGGLRTTFGDSPGFDLSLSYGNNEIEYRLANTLNPSLGPATPTQFRPGNLVNEEFAANADFNWPVTVGLASPLHAAFGFEYREEGYRIERGDPLSYAVGPFAGPDPFDFEITQAEVDSDPDDHLRVIECRIPGLEASASLCPTGDPVNNVVPVGSNGFPGYPPGFTSTLKRDSYAAYVDLELDVTPDWLVNTAGRLERYSDFGRVMVWKVATRYRLTGTTNLRASIGTGFRAPTPGQISTTNVSTRIDPNGLPVAEGIFPPRHPAPELFGARPLESEDSFSFTLGATTEPLEDLSVTLDYYQVRLDDRIVLSSQFSVGPEQVAQLQALGVPGANTIAQVRFFTNDVDSETRGIDLVATWEIDWSLGSSSLQAAFNFNETRLSDRGRFVDAEAEYDIRHGAPATRAVLSLRHTRQRFDLLLRGRYYGEYKNANTAELAEIQKFGRKFMVDAEVDWAFGNNYSLKLGGRNLFDVYPDRGRFETCCGRIYRSDSLVPWQGTLLYLQLAATF